MQRLEVSGAVRPIYGSLGVKRLIYNKIDIFPDRPQGPPSLLYNWYRVFPGGKVRPGRAADHSPASSAAVMEDQSYNPTQPLGHTGPVTGILYLFIIYIIYNESNFITDSKHLHNVLDTLHPVQQCFKLKITFINIFTHTLQTVCNPIIYSAYLLYFLVENVGLKIAQKRLKHVAILGC